MKTFFAVLMSIVLCVSNVCAAPEKTSVFEIDTPSAILMEVSTGQIIYDKNADEKLPPASVTKVMTLLLIFDALENGKIKLEDTVTVSEYAASMGGSQVFLEPGETQTVDTMIKCIAVASANDACVAFKYRRHSEKVAKYVGSGILKCFTIAFKNRRHEENPYMMYTIENKDIRV